MNLTVFHKVVREHPDSEEAVLKYKKGAMQFGFSEPKKLQAQFESSINGKKKSQENC